MAQIPEEMMVRKLFLSGTALCAALFAVPAAVVATATPALACTAGLWQNVRYVDGTTWLGWDQPPQPPGGPGMQVTNAAVGSGSSFAIHVDATTSSGIWDNVQYQTGVNGGNWQGWAQPTQPPGAAKWVTDAAMPDGSMQMLAVTTTGLYHDIRYANGSWQGWREPAQPPVNLADIGMYPVATGMSNGDMITIIGASGGVFYSDIRFANGSWSGWSQIPALPGNAGIDLAISGDKNGALQVMAIDDNGPDGQYGIQTNIYHNIWFSPPNGGWQGWALPTQPPQPTSSPSQSQIVTAATTPDGNTQFVDVTGTPDSSIQVYGDIRYSSNGLWQGWHQMPTPAGTLLDTTQGVPIAAPTWINFSADEVWADAPTFCPT